MQAQAEIAAARQEASEFKESAEAARSRAEQSLVECSLRQAKLAEQEASIAAEVSALRAQKVLSRLNLTTPVEPSADPNEP